MRRVVYTTAVIQHYKLYCSACEEDELYVSKQQAKQGFRVIRGLGPSERAGSAGAPDPIPSMKVWWHSPTILKI